MKIMLIFLVSMTSLLADSKFDKLIYRPFDSGLENISYYVEYPQLVDNLQKAKIFGELKKLKFKVIADKKKVNVEIEGFHGQFKEKKSEIKHIIAKSIEFFKPTYFAEVISGYEKIETKDNYNSYKDKEYNKEYTDIKIEVNENNLVKEMQLKKVSGQDTIQYDYEKESITKGLYFIKNISIESEKGEYKSKTQTSISYEKIENYLLPTSVSTKIENIAPTPKNVNSNKGVFETTYKFSNIKLNSKENKEALSN